MKTLELKTYGVQEMNRQEMVETEGGSLIGWGIAVGVIYLLTSCTYNDNRGSTTIITDSYNGNSDQQTIGHGNGNGNGSGNNNGNK